ncbi:cysteine dioxygenase [Pandoraea pneumonica]|uniref:cysteine dioxygenase family protein n=1 Tax=Pandoraea pneumonica TaxID=2508299 RepID=UPI003CE6FDC3
MEKNHKVDAHPDSPLRTFVTTMGALLDRAPDEATIVTEGRAALAALVADDTWLPEAYAQPDPARYTQYRLYVDPQARFSVVSFVWGPGQSTPVHDHTVWGLIGMLRGAEDSLPFARTDDGQLVTAGDPIRLLPGSVEAVSPSLGDIHQVRNAFDDRVSISIHVYGADIGQVGRSVYLPDGTRRHFVSGYANPGAPNLVDG